MPGEEMMGMLPTSHDPCADPPELLCSGENPETIDPDTDEDVAVLGGVLPMTWEISGTGFILQDPAATGVTNTVVAAVGSCGSVFVTVTDACDQSVECILRCTVGEWVNKINDVCVMSGVGTYISVDEAELIVGNKKQYQRSLSDGSGCPGHGCQAAQEEYCEGRGPLGLIENCIDPFLGGCDHPYAMPCSSFNWDAGCDTNVRFFPEASDCWQCFHVEVLQYWEWECE